jgi:hypothetical protein
VIYSLLIDRSKRKCDDEYAIEKMAANPITFQAFIEPFIGASKQVFV